VGNLGDEAIREAIEAGASILHASIDYYASRTERPRDARAVRLRCRAWPRYVRAIASVDRVVFGGGGILKDEGVGPLIELLATAVLARLLGRRVTLLAVGVGPFYTRIGRVLVFLIAWLASVRTVRDARSARYLAELGIGDIHVGADPVFTLSAPPLRGDKAPRPRRRVVFCLRPWFHMSARGQQRWDVLALQLSELATYFLDTGWHVHFSCLYWPRDRVASVDVVSRLDTCDAVSLQDKPMDWSALVNEFTEADYVVAMRYHALVAAGVTGKPVVALAYEPKVASLAVELGCPLFSVDDPLLAEAVVGLLKETANPANQIELSPAPDRMLGLRRRAWDALRLALST